MIHTLISIDECSAWLDAVKVKEPNEQFSTLKFSFTIQHRLLGFDVLSDQKSETERNETSSL